MVYNVQHNGKGKMHLHFEDGVLLCGIYNKNMLFDLPVTISIKNGILVENYNGIYSEIKYPAVMGYCNNCLNKLKNNK